MENSTITRIMATEESSVITKLSTECTITGASGHKITKIKLMEVAVTSSEDYIPPVEKDMRFLKKSQNSPATVKLNKKSTKTIIFPTIDFNMYNGDPLPMLWMEAEDAFCELAPKKEMPKKLYIESMVTVAQTGEVCTWKKNSFKDYDRNKEPRLVLRQVNNKPAEKYNFIYLTELVGDMMMKECTMKGKMKWVCSDS
jgi:hypothetical protein